MNKSKLFKELLEGRYVSLQELNNSTNNNNSKAAASTKTDTKVNQCLLLRNYIYGEK
jgi:hypothetical protein